MIERGIDGNVKDGSEKTVLHYAAEAKGVNEFCVILKSLYIEDKLNINIRRIKDLVYTTKSFLFDQNSLLYIFVLALRSKIADDVYIPEPKMRAKSHSTKLKKTLIILK
ncbi:MAG: hypothetical protein EOP34_05150 [Rickettsiales bacterium]|nr:MAG: hypothetical protein EOP34_05150 [Rickettsiales bacterium]